MLFFEVEGFGGSVVEDPLLEEESADLVVVVVDVEGESLEVDAPDSEDCFPRLSVR